MFGKVITAMVTPFERNGELSIKSLEKLVEHLLNNGTDSLLVGGTTGEGPTLSRKEKFKLIEETRRFAPNNKIIVNAGSNNTAQTIEMAKDIEEMGIADGILLVNPYYNKPSQEGLYRHFECSKINNIASYLIQHSIENICES